jgi:DNA-directed RNA polymerase beta' subunit
MLSTHNIFSPANGKPIISPSQDIVMGVYFITTNQPDEREEKDLKSFKDRREAILAYDHKKIGLHERIRVRLDGFNEIVDQQTGPTKPLPANKRANTTVGRVLFAEILEKGMPFYNCALGKKGCARVIDDTYAYCGRPGTIDLLDRMKETGFKQSTVAGLSFGITDLRIPEKKHELIDKSQERVNRVEKNFDRGIITARERYNQLLDIWSHCREEVQKELLKTLKADRRDKDGNEVPIDSKQGTQYLNPVYLMSDSGARGNVRRCSSWPACAVSWPSPRARSSRRPSGPTSARVSRSSSTSRPRTAPARVWPTRPQDRRLGLPHPQALRHRAVRHHRRVRLRLQARHHQARHLQGRGSRRSAPRPDQRSCEREQHHQPQDR